MAENFRMLAKTFYGFEELLVQELKELGAGKIEQGVRSVSFEGDLGFLYKANLCLRTALKIFKPISTFRVFNEKDLYRQVYEMDWDKLFTSDKTFAIDTTMNTCYSTVPPPSTGMAGRN